MHVSAHCRPGLLVHGHSPLAFTRPPLQAHEENKRKMLKKGMGTYAAKKGKIGAARGRGKGRASKYAKYEVE